jgi:UDP-glucose 4-epimerase
MVNLRDATVLITGGTGSFGSTMVRSLLSESVSEVRVFSRDEAKQDALRHELNDDRVRFYIGDTRDYDSIISPIRGADLVFHAAALKQVPSAEFFPFEAVKTNIIGSNNVLRASVEAGVKRVVCLSTDKAVYPINAMGMSKALMEKTAQAIARETTSTETVVAVTRYGNVMYSRGSVIPLFISQIKSGNPITITEPSMTRFLMSLSDSVDLVKFAFSNAQPGDLFVKKAPASTVLNLAIALIELFNGKEEKIQLIGFRHGEKLFESLLSSEESAKADDLGNFFRVGVDSRNLNYDSYFESGTRRAPDLQPYTSHNTEQLDVNQVKALLLTLPEIRRELGT